MKMLLCSVIITLLAVSAMPINAQSQKGQKVATAIVVKKVHPRRFASSVLNIFKRGGQFLLTGAEAGVDGIHDTFYVADKAFDVLSLQGRVPVLDQVYVLVGSISDDTGKLDDLLDAITHK